MPRRPRKLPDLKNPPPFLQQGNRLTAQRRVLQLTQQDAASKIGVTFQSLQQWEYGISSPRPGKWPKIEETYLRPRIWFMTGQEAPRTAPTGALAAQQAISLAIKDIRTRLDYLEALCGPTVSDAKVEKAGFTKVK